MDSLIASVCYTISALHPDPWLPLIPAVAAVLDLKLWQVPGSPGEPVKTVALIIQLPGPSSRDRNLEDLGYTWESEGFMPQSLGPRP